MANKAVPKKTKKELEEAKKRRLMIIIFAVIMIGIMIIVPLAVLFNPTPLHNAATDGGTEKTGTFNSIADALMDLPPNANYVRYVDLNASAAVTNWAESNIWRNLPNATLFGVKAQKDAVASYTYPALGLSVVEPNQVIVLSDLGPGYDNATYPKTTLNGAEMRIVQSPYAFSTDSYPIVSGRKEYVSLIDNFMRVSTRANSAYSTYSGLLEQANQSVMTAKFAVAGMSSSLGFGDQYYAGVTPLDNTMCDYKIVIHLNQTLNETQMQEIAYRWQIGASLYNIDANAPQFKDSYVVMSARGDTEACLNDMATNWYFIRE